MTIELAPGAQNIDHNNIPNIRSEVVKISSEQAADWLDRYQGQNRPISDTRVLQFQSDMEEGRWEFDGAPLRLSWDFKLLDGQHRLTALANCVPSREIPFLVVSGLDPDSQMVMDMGQARTTSQQLGMKKYPHAAATAAAVKLLLEWRENRLFKSITRSPISKPRVIQWVEANPARLRDLNATKWRRIDAPLSASGAFVLQILELDPVRAVQFIDQLVSGADLQSGDPILALINRLRNIRKYGHKLSPREYLALFIKAWNAWVSGERVTKIQVGEISAQSFPALMV